MPRSLSEESVTDSQLTAETAAPPTRRSELSLLGPHEWERKRKAAPNRWFQKAAPYVILLTATFKPTAYLDFAQGYFNYGQAAFAVLYLPLLALVGYPLTYLQLFVGQLSGHPLPKSLKNLCPVLGGVGFTVCIFGGLSLVSETMHIGLSGEGYRYEPTGGNSTAANTSNVMTSSPCNPNVVLMGSIMVCFVLATILIFMSTNLMEFLGYVMFFLMFVIVGGLGFASVWDSEQSRLLEVMFGHFDFQKAVGAPFWVHLFSCVTATLDTNFVVLPMVASLNVYKQKLVPVTMVVVFSSIFFSILAIFVVGAMLSNCVTAEKHLAQVLRDLEYFDHFIPQSFPNGNCMGRKLVVALLTLITTTRVLVSLHVFVETLEDMWNEKQEMRRKFICLTVSVSCFIFTIWMSYFRSREILARVHRAAETGNLICIFTIIVLLAWHLKSSSLMQKMVACQGPRFVPVGLPVFIKYFAPLFVFLAIILSLSVSNDNYPFGAPGQSDLTFGLLTFIPFLAILVYGGGVLRKIGSCAKLDEAHKPKEEWETLPLSEVRKMLIYESLERERLAPSADPYEDVGTVRKSYGKGKKEQDKKQKGLSRKPSWLSRSISVTSNRN